jgi:hypothetical protein
MTLCYFGCLGKREETKLGSYQFTGDTVNEIQKRKARAGEGRWKNQF